MKTYRQNLRDLPDGKEKTINKNNKGREQWLMILKDFVYQM